MNSREFNRKNDGNYAFLVGRLLGGAATLVVIVGLIWLGSSDLSTETKYRTVFVAAPVVIWAVSIPQLYYGRSKLASTVIITMSVLFTFFCGVGLGSTF